MCGCVLPKEHVWSRFHRRCRSKRCRRRGRPAWGEEVDAPRLTQPVLTNPGLVLSMTSASRHDHRSHGADEGSEMRRASHSASRQWGWGPLSGGGVIHCMCTELKILLLACGQQRLKRRPNKPRQNLAEDVSWESLPGRGTAMAETLACRYISSPSE